MEGPVNYAGLAGLDQMLSLPALIGNYQATQDQQAARALAAQQREADVEKIKRAQALAVQQQTLLDRAIATPNTANYNAYLLANPQAAAAIKQAHDALDEDQRNAELRYASSVHGYLTAGKPDLAADVVQKRIDADRAAGLDTSDDQRTLDLIKSGPEGVKAAQAMSGIALAGVGGADKFAGDFAQLGQEERAAAAEPGRLALVDAQTENLSANTDHTRAVTDELLHPAPEYVSAGIDPNTGRPVLYNKATGDIRAAPEENSDEFNAFVTSLIGSESGGQADAKNPNSSATGAGQFIDSTWRGLIGQVRPDLVRGKTPAEVLALRNDPAVSAEMTAAYAKQNAATLADAGITVNGATLAMAHKLGPGDAQKVLKAPDKAPLSSLLSKAVMDANPQLQGKTAGGYRAAMAEQFGTAPLDVSDPTADDGEMSDEAIAMVGQQYLSQGPSALVNLGQGKAGVNNKNRILNWAAQTAREAGTSNPQLVARFAQNKANLGALSQMQKNLSGLIASEGTLAANLDLAKGLAKKGVGPTGKPILDTPINELRRQFGSVDAKVYDNLLATTANEYAKILTTSSGTGNAPTSDAARRETAELLNSGMSLKQIIAAIELAKQEAENRRMATAGEINRLTAEISGQPAPQQVAATAPAASNVLRFDAQGNLLK